METRNPLTGFGGVLISKKVNETIYSVVAGKEKKVSTIRKRKQNEKWESYPALAKFADRVRECNKTNSFGQCNMMFQILALWGAVNCVLTIGKAIGGTGMTFCLQVFMVVFLDFLLGLYCGFVYCNAYTNIQGTRGKTAQLLWESVYRMPLSVEDYYKEIGRRFWKTFRYEGMAGFAIVSVIGFLLQLLMGFSLKMFMQMFGVYLLTATVLIGSMAAGYGIHRWYYLRKYHSLMEGKKRKPQKKEKGRWLQALFGPNTFWQEHKVLAFIVIVIDAVIVWASIFLQNYLLRLPDEVDLYRTIRSDSWIVFAVSVCGLYVAEKVIRFFLKEPKKGQYGWLVSLVLIAAAFVYSFTFYETYSEEKIEVKRCLWTKEYDWQDVKSYVVKKEVSAPLLQLELDMGDRKLDVMSMHNMESWEHYERYENEYLYAAYLVEKLDSMGVPGSLEDWETIETDVREWDTEEINAVKKIKQVVTGQGKRDYSDCRRD